MLCRAVGDHKVGAWRWEAVRGPAQPLPCNTDLPAGLDLREPGGSSPPGRTEAAEGMEPCPAASYMHSAPGYHKVVPNANGRRQNPWGPHCPITASLLFLPTVEEHHPSRGVTQLPSLSWRFSSGLSVKTNVCGETEASG